MNKKLFAVAIALLTFTITQPVSINAENSGSQVQMYRLYNPNSGEHFYTAVVQERNQLTQIGWHYEGVGWIAPEKSDTPVYRLYNRNGGEHHYTMNVREKNALVKAGWKDEGIGWYSDDKKSIPLLREYNPNQYSCNHNYTTSKNEHDHLVSAGWRDEGKSWYGISTQLIQTGTKTVVDKPAWDETAVDQPAWDEDMLAGDIYVCNDCGAEFNTLDELNNHTWEAHDANNYHTEPVYKTVHHNAVTHVVHHPAETHQEPVYDAK